MLTTFTIFDFLRFWYQSINCYWLTSITIDFIDYRISLIGQAGQCHHVQSSREENTIAQTPGNFSVRCNYVTCLICNREVPNLILNETNNLTAFCFPWLVSRGRYGKPVSTVTVSRKMRTLMRMYTTRTSVSISFPVPPDKNIAGYRERDCFRETTQNSNNNIML